MHGVPEADGVEAQAQEHDDSVASRASTRVVSAASNHDYLNS